MEFRKLSSLQVPSMGMGTYSTFDVTSESDISVRHQIIENCIEHDVTFVDSSPMYGNSEKVVGITTEGRRDKFQFATKVWCRGREEGEAQIARSFELLRTDYIEVFQIHNLVDWPTHLSTLERLKDEGKIGLVGITRPSNLEWSQDQGETELMGTSQPPNIAYPTMMEIMRSGRIDVVQIPYNVGDRNCEDELLPLAEDLGIGVIVMKPLEKGRYLTGFKRRPDLTPLAALGIQTWAQAQLAWVLGDPRVSVAIPATSRPERIKENALAGSIAPLPQELRDYIREETERCL